MSTRENIRLIARAPLYGSSFGLAKCNLNIGSRSLDQIGFNGDLGKTFWNLRATSLGSWYVTMVIWIRPVCSNFKTYIEFTKQRSMATHAFIC